MPVVPYSNRHADAWNTFIATSKNGTFLFDRGYMDYHQDRFEDASLMVLDDAGELKAVLPANRTANAIISHGGLTYGGLIVGPEIGTSHFLELFSLLGLHMKDSGVCSLEYKVIPSIYPLYPADEDRYALTLIGAELVRRDLSSVILPAKRLPLRKGRKSDLSKAIRCGLKVEESERWAEFWDILSENLSAKHGLKPVHALNEIQLLHERFPEQIRLFIVTSGARAVAGTVIYETTQVAHAQYIGCNEVGKKSGALDILLSHLLATVYANKPYFNFGISTTNNGQILNRGLIDFKESFGARSVVQDCYRVNLLTANLSALRPQYGDDQKPVPALPSQFQPKPK